MIEMNNTDMKLIIALTFAVSTGTDIDSQHRHFGQYRHFGQHLKYNADAIAVQASFVGILQICFRYFLPYC